MSMTHSRTGQGELRATAQRRAGRARRRRVAPVWRRPGEIGGAGVCGALRRSRGWATGANRSNVLVQGTRRRADGRCSAPGVNRASGPHPPSLVPAWRLTLEVRDDLMRVLLPAFRAGRRLLLQAVVLVHRHRDLKALAARRALEFVHSHVSPLLIPVSRPPPSTISKHPREWLVKGVAWRSGLPRPTTSELLRRSALSVKVGAPIRARCVRVVLMWDVSVTRSVSVE